VICDRHILDVFVDLKCELGKNVGHTSEQVIRRIAPHPKITFVLDAEPEEILLRKETGNLDLVKCKRHNYLISSRLSRRVLIDTGKSFDQNQREILTLFMKAAALEQN
jgi:thymidylate kinase